MKAGRELDALIAKHVFDITLRNITETSCELWHGDKWHSCGPCAHYSTDIADAWEVVEKLQESGLCVQAFLNRSGYQASFLGTDDKTYWGVAEADTAPLAICLAALKAVSQEGQG